MTIVSQVIDTGVFRGGRSRQDSLENPRMPLTDPEAWDAMGLLDGGAGSAGVRVTERRALGYPPWWRGICLISASVARLPLQVWKRTGENAQQKALTHPAYRLLRRKPNPELTAFHFKRTLMLHALVHGNGYAAIYRDNDGRPVELQILDPKTTIPTFVKGNLWYAVEAGKQKRFVRAEDILHIRGLAFDGLVGYSVIDVMGSALSLGVAARQFGSAFFSKGSQASGILMLPAGLSKEAADRLQRDWNKRTKGLDNAFKTAVLEEGAKWQQVTVSPEQAQFLQTRQFEVREVANILNLPPHKLGDDSKSSYNSLEQENLSYLIDCLDPWLVAWEEETADKLLTEQELEEDSHFTAFNRQALATVDVATETERIVKQTDAGILSVDEGRGFMSLPPLPDGLGKKHRFPLNQAFLEDTAKPADSDTAGAPADPNAEVQAQALNGAQVQSLTEVVGQVTAGLLPPESARAIIAAAFPLLTAEQVSAIIAPLIGFEPDPQSQDPPPASPPANPPAEDPPADPPADLPDDSAANRGRRVALANEIVVDRLGRFWKIAHDNRHKPSAWDVKLQDALRLPVANLAVARDLALDPEPILLQGTAAILNRWSELFGAGGEPPPYDPLPDLDLFVSLLTE